MSKISKGCFFSSVNDPGPQNLSLWSYQNQTSCLKSKSEYKEINRNTCSKPALLKWNKNFKVPHLPGNPIFELYSMKPGYLNFMER